MTTQLQTVLDALEMNRVMAADLDGNYTREITPEKIIKAIAIVRGMMEQEPIVILREGDSDIIPAGTPLYIHPADAMLEARK